LFYLKKLRFLETTMFDPTTRFRRRARWHSSRKGAIVPLFAILLPALLILCGFAINLAYMQLVTTELKISTDCAAHAGGRAMSIAQADDTLTVQQKRDLAIQEGISKAKEIATLNQVAGRTISVGNSGSGSEIEIGFGKSIRGDNAYGPGYGMYDYTETPTADILTGDTRPSSIRVTGNLNLPLVFRVMNNPATESAPARNISTFAPTRTSIATQVNRDVALVLDRSGSMLYYRDETELTNRINLLNNTSRSFRYYYYSRNPNSPDYWRGQWVEDGMPTSSVWDGPYSWKSETLISNSERTEALRGIYNRSYSDNLIYQLERWDNSAHTLGLQYSESWQHSSTQSDYDPQDKRSSNGDRGELTVPMAQYCRDYDNEYRNGSVGSPRHSRWAFLTEGVDAFLNVLDLTDQEELVSLVTFNSSATLDFDLQKSVDDDGSNPYLTNGYPNIRRKIATITPDGGTAVGDGMLIGLPPLIPEENGTSRARPFAAKTIVVLTDGVSNSGTSPEQAVKNIVGQADVTIHTVTFTRGADQSAMQAVAKAGRGRHYHDNDGSALVTIFEEIANNLPTILTE
jgi:hypothetical protein